MRTEYTDENIYARECFDSKNSNKSDTTYFCPFNIESKQYSWINETLMNDIEKGKLQINLNF